VLGAEDPVVAGLRGAREHLVGRPVVLAVLESGALVAALRVPRGAALVAAQGPVVLGAVRRAPSLHADALLRLDGDRALVGLPRGTDVTALAGLLEALAASEPPAAAPALVPDGGVHVVVRALGGTRVEPPMHLVARAVGNELRIDEVEPAPARPALTTPAPPWACRFEDAALLLTVPPMDDLGPAGAVADSFTGRMVVALYPPGPSDAPDPKDPLSYLSLVAAGVPKDDAAGAALFDSAVKAAGDAAKPLVKDGRSALEVPGRRPLRILSERGLFAVALGAHAPIERVVADGSCTAGAPLVLASGPLLARIVLPALMTPEVVLKALGGMNVEDALPLARLAGISLIRVDATPALRARIVLDVPK
jgi:hypothetical protein